MKAKEFDQRFEDGEDMLAHVDLSKARRPRHKQQRVNVDFTEWMVEALDREASRLGVSRQALIKIWLAERLEAQAEK